MESSKVPEEHPNSASEAETLAQTKRSRARRVSFADTEITSVHFFKRDDDSDTPPDSNQSSRNPNTNSRNENEVVGFFKDLGGDSDDSGDEDGRKSFFRPVGSPSPGSSTAGSATSNDEEIFFGPVSSSFIRRGQLSDSAVSSENNEETMDTTAFSMHYRSLVRSESGELMTPTAVRLAFEEKTPTQNTGRTKSGNSMSLTEPKKLINQPVLSTEKVRAGEDSDDMCIVGEKPNKYDYGSLPPTLDALLADDGQALHDESATDLINSQSSIGAEVPNGPRHMVQANDIDSELCHDGTDKMSVEPTSLVCINESEGSGDCLSKEDKCVATCSSISHKMSPSRVIRERKTLTEDVFASGMSELGSTAISSITSENTDDRVLHLNVCGQCESANRTSMHGLLRESSYKEGPDSDSIQNSNQQSVFPLERPFLPSIQHQSILSTPNSTIHLQSNVLSLRSKQSVSFFSQDGIQRDRTALSTQKSIPRFRVPDPSPAASSLKEGTNKLKSRLSKYSSMLSPFNDVQDANSNDFLSRYVAAPIACLEEQLLSVDLKNGEKHSTDITLLSTQLGCLEKSVHTGTEMVQSLCGRSTTELPSPKSPSRKELTESPSKTESDQKAAWKESTESLSQKMSSQSSHKKKPTMSPHLIEPRRSPRFRKEPPQSPSKKKLAQSPSELNPPTAAHNENIPSFVGEQRVSSKSKVIKPSTDDFHKVVHTLRSPLGQNTEISFEQKRRRESVVEDVDHTDKVPRIEKFSGVHGSINYDSELILDSDKNDDQIEKVDGDSRQKSWPEILEKFSTDAKHLLSPSINKLNLRAIGKMEDILVPFLKFKCSEFQSKKIADHISLRNKRVAEMTMSLYRIVCENAKLQLQRAKLEKLQKRRHLLSSRIQDCQMLKLNYTQQQSESHRRDTYLGDSHLIYYGDEKVVSDKVGLMKQEIIALDGKIKSLSNSFHNVCKLKEEPSCTETIGLVHDHIQTRMQCRLLRQDLQGWQVDDFKNSKGCYSILLNYRGYLSQRFMVKSVPVSSIDMSRELKDINIVKNFPNMDACVAFAFVLKALAPKRCAGSKYLVRETQVTRSLLCNLLDVLQEVKLARINIENLIQTSFYSPSVKQLDLKLFFINFNSGKKVTLILDVTCLNSGVYPSEIIPYKVEASGSQSSLLDEVSAAAENLEVGYLRITRLCRYISQLWQA